MEDARARISSARAALERLDYVNALSEASLCVELTAKAFLDLCKVSYEMERGGQKGRLMHDVSSRIPQLFPMVKDTLTDIGRASDTERYAKILGRLMVMNRILWSVGEYVDFGIKDMNLGATDLISFDFSEIVKAIVGQAGGIHSSLQPLYEEMAIERMT